MLQPPREDDTTVSLTVSAPRRTIGVSFAVRPHHHPLHLIATPTLWLTLQATNTLS